MEPQNDLPPLQTITQSGVYRLKLSLPKFEQIRENSDGTIWAALFFKAADGACLRTIYGTKYPKSLAILVGKLTGKFMEEKDFIRTDARAAEFIEYLKPAVGKYAEIAVEVTPNGQYHKYKLSFGRGSQKPTPPEASSSNEALPF
jgi:hypothetical protein